MSGYLQRSRSPFSVIAGTQEYIKQYRSNQQKHVVESSEIVKMIRNRRRSTKPTDEFFVSFKQNFPDVACASSSTSMATEDSIIQPNALKDEASDQQSFDEQQDFKLDGMTFGLNSFPNQFSPYYSPNTLYRSQAGDLHTPALGLGMNLHNSYPMPHVDNAFLPNTQYTLSNDFDSSQQNVFQPNAYVNQSPGNVATAQSQPVSPGEMLNISPAVVHRDSEVGPQKDSIFDILFQKNQSRFATILHAQTAMVRHPEETPITYLNKGQAYSIVIKDTEFPPTSPSPIRYRTFIRISFDEKEQRLRPTQCWQLWKDGRGTNEAIHHDGKLQAVEHVESASTSDDIKNERFEVQSTSFDGFSILWTPDYATGRNETVITVRFNFLSTDFSHSKGVKGIPVRLCSKTEVYAPNAPEASVPEICYCKVKLFRDHGAERKMTNDANHAKKTIEKLNAQIEQVDSGMHDFGKRKRCDYITGADLFGSMRPGKVPKHKRTWSLSSASSTGRVQASVKEDLQSKMQSLKGMFQSMHEFSYLNLKGDEHDDPDLYPIQLGPIESTPPPEIRLKDLRRQRSWDQRRSSDDDVTPNSVASPTPSSESVPMEVKVESKGNMTQQSSSSSQQELDTMALVESELFLPNDGAVADAPMKVQKAKVGSGGSINQLSDWIEALGVDATYRPPMDSMRKPVACIYVLVKTPGAESKGQYYRAVYLMKRTIKDLVVGIASKVSVDPRCIVRVTRIIPSGLAIIVDEDVVQQLPEGQDMVVDVSEVSEDKNDDNDHVHHHGSYGDYSSQLMAEVEAVDANPCRSFEMKLIY